MGLNENKDSSPVTMVSPVSDIPCSGIVKSKMIVPILESGVIRATCTDDPNVMINGSFVKEIADIFTKENYSNICLSIGKALDQMIVFKKPDDAKEKRRWIEDNMSFIITIKDDGLTFGSDEHCIHQHDKKDSYAEENVISYENTRPEIERLKKDIQATLDYVKDTDYY